MASDLGSWLKRLAGRKNDDQLNIVCRRFLEVFRLHGVETSQIPRLLPQVKLADLQSHERLLAVLTPELLDQVAALFCVRLSWLEGVDDRIYDYLASCKEPKLILEHINAVLTDERSRRGRPIRVLCTKKKLDHHSKDVQDLAPVIVEKIAELGEESIFRYHVYRDGFPWDHPPARIELKALARTIYKKLGITVPLYEIPEREMDELLEGRLIPGFLRSVCHHSTPSLEDYALTASESGVARETEELEDVLRYIDEQGLSDFRFVTFPAEVATDQNPGQVMNGAKGEVSVKANAVKAANKKHARTNEIKQRFVQFYRDHEKDHESKSAAAKTFFKCVLNERDRLEFKEINTALRVFLEALRKAGAGPQQ